MFSLSNLIIAALLAVSYSAVLSTEQNKLVKRAIRDVVPNTETTDPTGKPTDGDSSGIIFDAETFRVGKHVLADPTTDTKDVPDLIRQVVVDDKDGQLTFTVRDSTDSGSSVPPPTGNPNDHGEP